MVALAKLRLNLIAGAFRGNSLRAFRASLMLAVALLAGVSVAVLPGMFVPKFGAHLTVILVSVVALAAWLTCFFRPELVLSPRHFAQVPVGVTALSWRMLLTGVISRAGLLALVLVAVLGFVWGFSAVDVACMLLLFAVLLLGGRVCATFGELAQGERRVMLLRVVGLLVLCAAVPPLVLLSVLLLRGDALEPAGVSVPLAWTPFGAPVWVMSAGKVSPGVEQLLPLVVPVGFVLLCVALWMWLVRVSLTTVFKPAPLERVRRGLGWFERFPARPMWVIAARELTYWLRDARYRVQLFAVPVAPFIAVCAFWVAGAHSDLLAMLPLPLVVLLLAWVQHNAVAMDSTAIWMHVAGGTRGIDDRVGRLAPVMLLGVPVVVVGSSITVAALGDVREILAVFGMNLAVLGVTAGVTSLCSVLMPYPATKPEDSPFTQPQWQGSGAGLSQTVSMLASLLLSAPAVVLSSLAVLQQSFLLNVAAIVFGVLWGGGVLLLGVVLGGRVFDRNGPELIAVTQVFD